MVDQIYYAISKLDSYSLINVFAHITSTESAVDRQMRAKDGWQNPAVLDKKACVLLRNVRSKVEHDKNMTIFF